MEARKGWIGVDFDGTLATHPVPGTSMALGDPIPRMVARVKRWLDAGQEVRIVTARGSVYPSEGYLEEHVECAIGDIKTWCRIHLGVELPVQGHKDFGMIELWDDLAVAVVQDTGDIASQRSRINQ